MNIEINYFYLVLYPTVLYLIGLLLKKCKYLDDNIIGVDKKLTSIKNKNVTSLFEYAKTEGFYNYKHNNTLLAFNCIPT
jgi:hypothetical protein